MKRKHAQLILPVITALWVLGGAYVAGFDFDQRGFNAFFVYFMATAVP